MFEPTLWTFTFKCELHLTEGFSKIAFDLVKSIYRGGWDNLLAGNGFKLFKDKIKEKFTIRVLSAPMDRKSVRFPPFKPVKFTNIPLPMNLSKLPKEERAKPKSNKKPVNDKSNNSSLKPACTYAQASSTNIQDILKLKENFPKSSDKKIKEIYKMVHNSNISKLRLNMTTKGPLCKQIIVPIGNNNIKTFMSSLNDHVVNINQALKNVKSDIIIDFICSDHRGLVLVLNKVVAQSDICIISYYVKNANNINLEDIQDSRFPQSKSYLKILGLPYLLENTNTSMDLEFIENIIKTTHIFNNIKVASKPYVCKVSPKSDMAIVWINIWNLQNGSSAKKIIN